MNKSRSINTFEEKKKKIFVGIVTNTERKGYCREALINNIQSQEGGNFELVVFMADNAKNNYKDLYPEWINYAHLPLPERDHSIREVLAEQRNMLRKQFLKMKEFDYFMSWESDVILPKRSIARLLENIQMPKIDVITAINIHHKGEDSNLPIAITAEGAKLEGTARQVDWDDVLKAHEENEGMMKIAGSGVGCSLIKREVLEKVRFRVELDKGAFDDMFFSKDVNKEGYVQLMDCRIIADHRQGGWEGVRK